MIHPPPSRPLLQRVRRFLRRRGIRSTLYLGAAFKARIVIKMKHKKQLTFLFL
jgi:hypothetical protein